MNNKNKNAYYTEVGSKFYSNLYDCSEQSSADKDDKLPAICNTKNPKNPLKDSHYLK